MSDDNSIAFTAGELYRAKEDNWGGLKGNPYEVTPVLCAVNDNGVWHSILHLDSNNLNGFFERHFKKLN